MKTTLKGLQALQIALRNRVERLPDGSVAIQIKNDFTAVTLGDMCAIIEASGSTIRLTRELESGYHLYFKTSRNQAKRLQEWVDSAIARHEFEQDIQAAAQAGEKAGENLRTMFAAGSFFKLEIDPSLVARIRKKRIGKTPNSFPPADFDRPMPDFRTQEGRDAIMQQSQAVPPFGFLPSDSNDDANDFAKSIAARKAKEAAKDKQIAQLQADLEAANLTKDGAIKAAQKLKEERDKLRDKLKVLSARHIRLGNDYVETFTAHSELGQKYEALQAKYGKAHDLLDVQAKENSTLKTTNAELVRQAQAHNQEAIRLREALANMTRLRDEAAGQSVRLPKEGDVVEYRNTRSSAWGVCSVAVSPYDLPYAPDKFGRMYLEAENHGILWRWPATKERTAADAKKGDRVWFILNEFKIISKIHYTTNAGAINIDCPASPGKRGLFLTHKSHFGKTWGFAD